MMTRSITKTIIVTAIFFLTLANAIAEETLSLSPGQRFFFETVAGLDEAQRQEKVKKFQEYYDTIFTAPLFVVILVDRQSTYPDYNRFDGPMAAANLFLAARALGYGTVFYTDTISEDVTRRVLQIPERYEQVCITSIGVPGEWPKAPAKKELSEFIVYESFPEK